MPSAIWQAVTSNFVVESNVQNNNETGHYALSALNFEIFLKFSLLKILSLKSFANFQDNFSSQILVMII